MSFTVAESSSSANKKRRKASSQTLRHVRAYSPPTVDLTCFPPASSTSSSSAVAPLFFNRATSTGTDTGRCKLCFNCVDADTLTRHPLTNELAIRHVRESHPSCCSECARYVLQAYGTDVWQCDMCTSIDGFHDLFSCSACHSNMCRTCIVAHYGRDAARNVMQLHSDEPDIQWLCFGCQEFKQMQSKKRLKSFKFPFRTHLALTDLVSSDASLSYYNIFNPFKLERSVPGMTYHTFLHPYAQQHFRANPARAFQSILGVNQSCPDEMVRCVRFADHYSLHVGMNTSWRDAVTSPSVTVPIQSVQSINKVLFPNRHVLPSASFPSFTAPSAAASSSSSSSSSLRNKNSASTSSRSPLLKIVSTSIYRHAEEGSNHNKRNGGSRHPVYVQGLLNVVRRFRSVFPAEENWVLRIYYDQSMERPCPCEKCLTLVRKGKPELYPLPDAWSFIKDQLMDFPFVQLRYFNWPAYQHVQGFEDQNPSNYHLGHLGMFARFLALAELGITAQLVLFSDLDGSWSPLWKEQVDRMLENKSSVLRMNEPDYMLPLWGGATAFAYHPDALVPLSFLGIESSMHEFCTWHLQHPDVLKEHPCMALHFKKFLSEQEKKLEIQWKKMELQQIEIVGMEEAIDDKEVERLYAKHCDAHVMESTQNRTVASNEGSESKDESHQSVGKVATSTIKAHRRRPLSKPKKKVKKGQTRTFSEIGQTIGWTEAEEAEATDECRSTCFPYGSDQAFLLYCVWNIVVEAETETQKQRAIVSDCMENHTPQYEFIRTVPVTLPVFSKTATIEAAQSKGVLCMTRYLTPLGAVNPLEADIEIFARDYFRKYMNQKFKENGFRDESKLKRSLSNSESQTTSSRSEIKHSSIVRAASYSAAIPHPTGMQIRSRAKINDERKHSVNKPLGLQAIPEKKRSENLDATEDEELPSTQPAEFGREDDGDEKMEVDDGCEEDMEGLNQDHTSGNKRQKLESPSTTPTFHQLPAASLTSFSTVVTSAPRHAEHKSQFKAKRSMKTPSNASVYPIASNSAMITPVKISIGHQS